MPMPIVGRASRRALYSTALIATSLGALTVPAEAALFGNDRAPGSDPWKIQLGAAIGTAPRYEGAERMRIVYAPLIDVTWRDTLFLSTQHGIGANIFRSENFVAGFSFVPTGGRKERDGPRLKGLGKIEDGIGARGFVAYELGPFETSFAITRELSGKGGGGTSFDLGIGANFPITSNLSFGPSISATWADGAYMQRYFGVTPAQSARSGLPAFKPGAGLQRIDAMLKAQLELGRYTITAAGGVGRLMGDAKKSPIVEKRTQPLALVAVTYRF